MSPDTLFLCAMIWATQLVETSRTLMLVICARLFVTCGCGAPGEMVRGAAAPVRPFGRLYNGSGVNSQSLTYVAYRVYQSAP
jgi:hypothetical protein